MEFVQTRGEKRVEDVFNKFWEVLWFNSLNKQDLRVNSDRLGGINQNIKLEK